MRTRDFRRHQSQRVKRNWFKKLRNRPWNNDDDEWLQHRVVRSFNNRAQCSCHMCGNPRKHWKDKTIQERKLEKINEIIAGMEKG